MSHKQGLNKTLPDMVAITAGEKVGRAIDILQPDCAHTGGITQMKKIATLAAMPTRSVSAAVIVNAGVRRRERDA